MPVVKRRPIIWDIVTALISRFESLQRRRVIPRLTPEEANKRLHDTIADLGYEVRLSRSENVNINVVPVDYKTNKYLPMQVEDQNGNLWIYEEDKEVGPV